ncbi:hypothetical protein [Methylomonas fluvii]|uniref:Uncharacterized protein n=1 Tax=Methylomonas fluvii TaxID=1854564 RepID=A0ABR9DC99_9GAMM|nr:hypothetical protein [Methylomonas fluvii]MBD9359933.1 hypothetical protein [Methylomonas fluvii]
MKEININIDVVRKITNQHVITAFSGEIPVVNASPQDENLEGCDNHFDESFFNLLRNGAHADFNTYNF